MGAMVKGMEAIIELAREWLLAEPVGCYLLEQNGERLILWKLSEGEPDETAFDPADLWPMLLTDEPVQA